MSGGKNCVRRGISAGGGFVLEGRRIYAWGGMQISALFYGGGEFLLTHHHTTWEGAILACWPWALGDLVPTLSTTINNMTWSDHASVSLTVQDSIPSTNTFIWRSNPRIMQHTEHKLEMEKHVSDFFMDNQRSVED